MKVSIITAVRNGASTIARTIESVRAQTWADIEHVIVDGASTDATAEVARAAQPRNCRMISERDRGIYDAFNKGLRLATGDLIGYLNCGDWYWDANVIRDIVARFEAAGTDAVFGDLAITDADDLTRIVRHYSSGRFSPARVAWGFMPAHPTLFLRRHVYQECGEYDASYRIAGDFELVARVFCVRRASYSYIPRQLVCMPRGGASSGGLKSNWIITTEMNRACAQNNIRTSLARLMLRFPLKAVEWIRPLAAGASPPARENN